MVDESKGSEDRRVCSECMVLLSSCSPPCVIMFLLSSCSPPCVIMFTDGAADGGFIAIRDTPHNPVATGLAASASAFIPCCGLRRGEDVSDRSEVDLPGTLQIKFTSPHTTPAGMLIWVPGEHSRTIRPF